MKKQSDHALIARMRELIAVYGRWAGSNQDIADALNVEGVVTSQGKPWTAGNVSAWLTRHKGLVTESRPDTKPSGEVTESQKDTNVPPEVIESQGDTSTEPEVTESQEPTTAGDDALAVLAELYRSGKITEVISWYEATKGEAGMIQAIERRPMFKGERRNTGIKLSKSILDAAVAKCKTEPQRVGGSFSQLVEYLLWRYIGSPAEMVEGIDQDAS
jgi:hypothetical protein